MGPCTECTNWTTVNCPNSTVTTNNMKEVASILYIKDLSYHWSVVSKLPIGMGTASNWKDNTTYIIYNSTNIGLGLFPYLPRNGIEDMFPYKDCNGKWHAIFHSEIPAGDNVVVCGGHGFSDDGINWIYGGLAFNNIVQYQGGEMYTFNRRERHHLVFDKTDNCTLNALTSSVEYTCDATFTFIQPIKH